METMVPLGSVLGWIFAVVGLLVVTVCFATLMAESAVSSDEAKRFSWVFAIAEVLLVAGVIFVVRYWGGGA